MQVLGGIESHGGPIAPAKQSRAALATCHPIELAGEAEYAFLAGTGGHLPQPVHAELADRVIRACISSIERLASY